VEYGCQSAAESGSGVLQESLRTLFRYDSRLNRRRHEMTLGTILLVILVLLLIGVIPTWPHSRGWGYGPSGIVGVVLLILLVLFLMGKI
jgi:hypothetical protein